MSETKDAGGAVPSVRDSLVAAFEQAEGGSTGDTGATGGETGGAAAATGADTGGGPARDPATGKFTSPASGTDTGATDPGKTAAAVTGADKGAAAAQTDPAAVQQQAATGLEPIEAPAIWPAEEKEAFAKLAPDAQRLVVQMRNRLINKEYTEKTTQLATERQRIKEIEDAVGPRLAEFSRRGMTPGQALGQLFAIEKFATDNPVDFMLDFAQQRGIDLAKLAAHAAAQGAAPAGTAGDGAPAAVDPALLTRLERLERGYQTVNGQIQTFAGAQTAAQQAQIGAEVASFCDAADATGAPLHPHFEAVADDMMALLPVLRQRMPGKSNRELLEAAYDQAVYANPETRKATLAAQTRKDQAERERQAIAAAEEARRKGVTVTGSPPGSVSGAAAQNLSIRQSLEQAWDAASGRV